MIKQIETKGCEAYMANLAKMSGKTYREIVRAEVGPVLSGCIRKTRIAKKTAYPRSGAPGVKQAVAKLDIVTDANKVRTSGVGAVWLSMPPDVMGKSVAGGPYVHYLIAGPGGSAPMRNGRPIRWSDRRWALAQSMLAEARRKEKEFISRKLKNADGIRAQIRGRGLAKQSWLQSADDLGLQLPGIDAAIRSAVPQDGIPRKSGSGREVAEGGEFYIEIENRYPLLCGGARKPKGLDGAGALRGSIAGRVSHFNRAVSQGDIDDLKFRTSHFPGVFVE